MKLGRWRARRQGSVPSPAHPSTAIANWPMATDDLTADDLTAEPFTLALSEMEVECGIIELDGGLTFTTMRLVIEGKPVGPGDNQTTVVVAIPGVLMPSVFQLLANRYQHWLHHHRGQGTGDLEGCG